MDMIVVVHYGEIALKKKNRAYFEKRLVENIRERLKRVIPPSALHERAMRVERRFGRIVVTGEVTRHRAHVERVLATTFGIENFSFAHVCRSDMDDIERAVGELAQHSEDAWQTFRVTTVRSWKQFPLKSMEVNRRLGGVILGRWPQKQVQMKGSDKEIVVEITDRETYVLQGKIKGPGGLPTGSTGRVMCLLSGGIDSPVAAFRMMKRGCSVDFVHFHSAPYTDRASLEKVRKRLMTETDARFRVLLYRRCMVRIAERLARGTRAQALVTGESLAQVASQTLENMAVVEAAASMPILRPLVGMDKSEIMREADAVGTFETSKLPHEDCCTLFTPRHPATKAHLKDVENEEARVPLDELVAQTVRGIPGSTTR
ncbi:tRNA sulfurtransferase [Candidatus Uhrbacteria bacterium]|nr:tRNA sulfurtransferase [Candidatus Uhrbacteria bacterium]